LHNSILLISLCSNVDVAVSSLCLILIFMMHYLTLFVDIRTQTVYAFFLLLSKIWWYD